MKTYIFGHPSGALFVSPKGLRIALEKGDKFEIGTKEDQAYVVQNGKGIRITEKERRDLVRKSEQLKPSADHKSRIELLYKLRKFIQQLCLEYAEGIELTNVKPFYERTAVGVSAECSYGIVVLGFNANTVGVALYCKDAKRLSDALKSEVVSKLERRARRLSRSVNVFVEDFKSLKSHLGNIRLPVTGNFTGSCYSYHANWYIEA